MVLPKVIRTICRSFKWIACWWINHLQRPLLHNLKKLEIVTALDFKNVVASIKSFLINIYWRKDEPNWNNNKRDRDMFYTSFESWIIIRRLNVKNSFKIICFNTLLFRRRPKLYCITRTSNEVMYKNFKTVALTLFDTGKVWSSYCSPDDRLKKLLKLRKLVAKILLF